MGLTLDLGGHFGGMRNSGLENSSHVCPAGIISFRKGTGRKVEVVKNSIVPHLEGRERPLMSGPDDVQGHCKAVRTSSLEFGLEVRVEDSLKTWILGFSVSLPGQLDLTTNYAVKDRKSSSPTFSSLRQTIAISPLPKRATVQ